MLLKYVPKYRYTLKRVIYQGVGVIKNKSFIKMFNYVQPLSTTDVSVSHWRLILFVLQDQSMGKREIEIRMLKNQKLFTQSLKVQT